MDRSFKSTTFLRGSFTGEDDWEKRWSTNQIALAKAEKAFTDKQPRTLGEQKAALDLHKELKKEEKELKEIAFATGRSVPVSEPRELSIQAQRMLDQLTNAPRIINSKRLDNDDILSGGKKVKDETLNDHFMILQRSVKRQFLQSLDDIEGPVINIDAKPFEMTDSDFITIDNAIVMHMKTEELSIDFNGQRKLKPERFTAMFQRSLFNGLIKFELNIGKCDHIDAESIKNLLTGFRQGGELLESFALALPDNNWVDQTLVGGIVRRLFRSIRNLKYIGLDFSRCPLLDSSTLSAIGDALTDSVVVQRDGALEAFGLKFEGLRNSSIEIKTEDLADLFAGILSLPKDLQKLQLNFSKQTLEADYKRCIDKFKSKAPYVKELEFYN